MAITTTNLAAASVATLITRARRALGDTETLAANQRFSDALIADAINFECAKMFAEIGINNPEQLLASADLSYNGDSVAIPAAALNKQIYMVEDITNADMPVRLNYIAPMELENYESNPVYFGAVKRWTLLGDNIYLRPDSATTIRIWYINNPFVFGLDGSGEPSTATDQHKLLPAHEELISLGAAIRLQEIDDEIPQFRLERYNDLWLRFLADIRRTDTPMYVRSSRRWRR